jgi:hypothetical protein
MASCLRGAALLVALLVAACSEGDPGGAPDAGPSPVDMDARDVPSADADPAPLDMPAPPDMDEGTDGPGGFDGGRPGFTCPPPVYGPGMRLRPFTNASAGSRDPVTIDGEPYVLVARGFESLEPFLDRTPEPFPLVGPPPVWVALPNVVRSVEFVVPSREAWVEPPERTITLLSWPNQWEGGSAAYARISACPGDLRIPAEGRSGTVDDPTFADGCSTWQRVSWDCRSSTGEDRCAVAIRYDLGAEGDVSTPDRCVLVPGRRYYLNVYMVTPRPDRTFPPYTPALCEGYDESNPCGHRFRVM